jgi:hypothetical protein
MYQYENNMLNYFPTFTKTPVYIDNTNTILSMHHSLANIIINVIINISNFIKNVFFISTGIILSISSKFKIFCLQYILSNNYYYEKLFLVIFITTLYRIYCFQNNKFTVRILTNKIEELEEKIKFLNKKETFLENDVERYTLINKKSQEEMDKKLKYYEKEMKKMKKEINKYN